MKQNSNKGTSINEPNVQAAAPLSKNPKFLTSAISYIQDHYLPAGSETPTNDKRD